MKHRSRRGLLRAVGATIAAGALALGGAVAASAAPGDSVATIDGTKPVSITITKYSNPGEGLTEGTGAADQAVPEGAKTIKGVEYELWRVDPNEINLTTNEGWQDLAKAKLELSDENEPVLKGKGGDTDAVYTITSMGTDTTTDQGVAAFNPSPVEVDGELLYAAAYILQEVASPGTVIANLQPSLITAPMSKPESNGWNYNVHIYPKNAQLLPTKKVNDADALSPLQQGSTSEGKDKIVYTITAQLPSFADPRDEDGNPEGVPFTKVEVVDDLPDGLSAATAVVAVKVGDAALTKETDFTVTQGTGDDSQKLTIALTESYRDDTESGGVKLNGKWLEVTITADVNDDVKGGYDEANKKVNTKNPKNVATLNVATGEGDDEKASATTEPEVESKYGGGEFENLFPEDKEPSSGTIQFAIYDNKISADAGGTDWLQEKTFDLDEGTGSPQFIFDGLRNSNWAMGTTQKPGEWDGAKCVWNGLYQIYYLVQLEAPAGYQILAKPIPVVVVDGELKKVPEPPVWQEVDQENPSCELSEELEDLGDITSVEKNAGFDLPLTGGWGTIWLMVAGGLLLAVVLTVARRRKSVEG